MWIKNQVYLKNIHFNIYNNKDFEEKIIYCISKKKQAIFSYVNSYSYYLINKSKPFHDAIINSEYIRVGGKSIEWGLRFLSNKNLDKVTFNHHYLHFGGDKFLAKNNFRIFLFGSDDNTLKMTLKNLEIRKENLNIVGSNNGYLNNKISTEIIKKINDSNPDILLVGLGTPKSDIWISENYKLLNNIVIIKVGNFIDILGGKVKIAPKFLFNSAFEWLFRLVQEPKRMSKRYLISNFYFIRRIIDEFIKK